MNRRLRSFTIVRILLAITFLGGLVNWSSQPTFAASQIDIYGPIGSGRFGETVTVLPNGNIVVTDPYFNNGLGENVGAVYLYDSASSVRISRLTGSSAGDQIGSGGVVVLSNGNYLVISPNWDNGAATDAGAVSWGSAKVGVSGVVSASNSLVGSTTSDQIGTSVSTLSYGNYVVTSLSWDNNTLPDAGAVTWGNGSTGVSGEISAANSLVGSTANDHVGCRYDENQWGGYWICDCVTSLNNGNYVVRSIYWDNSEATDVGAITWGNGNSGVSGVISATNSVVGNQVGDRVGKFLTTLSNGNYVVISPYWDNGAIKDAGAVTWLDGTARTSGVVSVVNSLIGSKANDLVGCDGWDWCYPGVEQLSNGNYLVMSSFWDNGAAVDAGAVTWGSGTHGVSGVVSAANSLVGSTTSDQVGVYVTPLNNGNYLVSSVYWDNGSATDAGAVTWGNGAAGTNGVVSVSNSLVGKTADDHVGDYVVELSNGNYVVNSPHWNNGAVTHAGAVTWGNGSSGITGLVSAANSLVGSTANDLVGCQIPNYDQVSCWKEYLGVVPLSNGNYVVLSPQWDNGVVTDAGAATWGNGTSGVSGVISAATSLVGNQADDHVGLDVTPLNNGNYVVTSPYWDNEGIVDAGAVTWGNGAVGTPGIASAANSLVGNKADDLVGCYDAEYCEGGVASLSNGNYVVISPNWDDGILTNAGAATWGNGTSGVSGGISAANSLVGGTGDDRIGCAYFYPSDELCHEWGVTILSNGNYVISSLYWDNGAATDAGAATWGNGLSGTNGIVSAANSLVGNTSNYYYDVGCFYWGSCDYGVIMLSNGDYIVKNPDWSSKAVNSAGAVTWGNGITGVSGVISDVNSLVGIQFGDNVGIGGVTILSDGSYVVSSPDWDNGPAEDAGAVTWSFGASGVSGPITVDNSVRGTAANGGYAMFYLYDPVNSQLVVSRPYDNIVTLFTTRVLPDPLYFYIPTVYK